MSRTDVDEAVALIRMTYTELPGLRLTFGRRNASGICRATCVPAPWRR